MMKNNNEKQLRFVSDYWLKPLIMTKLRILFLICSMTTVSANTVFADDPVTFQQNTVRGTVTDATTSEALIGVSVVVKGTTVGQLTDIDGKFSIPVDAAQTTLIFSFIGYTTQEIVVTPGTNLTVAMELAVTQISEVVVVGYGTQKKESVVGAIAQVSNAELVNSGTTNITNAISGKLSGVLTIQQVGEPGKNSSEIYIRGLSSWNTSVPLVLVDGVERDFSNIDPNEINTISVLKDASATAVFGAKGANGVIIVTTKRGSLGKPKFDFSASYGIEKATRLPVFIDSYTTMRLLNVGLMNDQKFTSLIPQNILEEYRNPSTPLNALKYPNVNWFDELTKPFAPTFQTNFSLQGGTQFVKYFCLLGFYNQGDFFNGYNEGYDDTRYKYNRFNYRGNVDFTLTKTTQFSLNLGGEIGSINQPSGDMWTSLYNVGPSRFPAYFPDWVLEQVPDPDYPDASGRRLAQSFGERYDNPYSLFNMGSFNKYLDSNLFTDIILDQKLDFLLKGLSLKGKVSLSTYYNHRSLYANHSFPQYILDYNKIDIDANGDGVVDANPWFRMSEGPEVFQQEPLDINVGGMEGGYYTDLYYEVSLSYANTFGKHSLSGLALMNRQQKNRGTDFPYYNEALVGRATYAYSRKYLLELNIGYTGSERFAPENRFGFFPSAAIGWAVSEEEFFKNSVPWMNKLKIRYSDGLVGSDYASNRWLYVSEYYTSSISSYQTLPATSIIAEDKGANSNAQWEQARKRDIGIEFGIFKNMFTFSIDFFDEYRNNMLLKPQSVTMMVGNSFKELNLGKLKKQGFEVEAEFNKTTANNIKYFIRGMFGYNENRVLFKDDLPYAPEHTRVAGKPLDAQLNGVLLSGTGYFTTIDDIHVNPAPIPVSVLNVGDYKFLDYNVDGKITMLDKYPIKGSFYPPVTYSFSSGLSYKGFEFNFLFQGNVGKYISYGMRYESEFTMGDWIVGKSQLDYWRPDNQGVNHATLHYYSGGGGLPNLSWAGGDALGYSSMIKDKSWRNADYLRLKEIYAGYTFNSEYMKRVMGISNFVIYVAANNLLTFTKLIEGDPEKKEGLRSRNYFSDYSGGYDATGMYGSDASGFYPFMFNIKLGLKIGF